MSVTSHEREALTHEVARANVQLEVLRQHLARIADLPSHRADELHLGVLKAIQLAADPEPRNRRDQP